MNSDKKILIITYYWPPSGGPAVQRWLSLTSELAGLGWEVFVLTVDEKYATYQVYDTSHADRMHEKVKVIKTRTREPFGIYKMLFGKKSIPAPGFSNESNPSLLKKIARFVRGNLFIPDPRKGWRSFAVKAAAALIKKENIRQVITAGPPHSTHLTGASLKKIYPSIQWTCDFHDLWTDVIYYNMLYHLPWIKRKDAALEKKILEDADNIITVGEKYKEKLLGKSSSIDPGKFHIARIGYDQHLFNRKSETTQQKFVITYTGTIADYYQPEVFFKAFRKTIDRHPGISFTFRMVGIMAENLKKLVIEYRLGDVLEETGYVAHARAIEALHSSTCLLLVNPVTRDEAMVIPGKIYEYLGARKPIINITVAESETARLIAQCNAGDTFARNEEERLENYLATLVDQWQQQRTLDLPYDPAIEIYSRKNIAAKLGDFLLSRHSSRFL